MKLLSRSIFFAAILAMALVVAACDTDDADDEAVPGTTDDATAVDDTATDDAATDDVATDDATPDTEATPETDDAVTDDATPDDAVTDDATPETDVTPDADATPDTDDAVAEDEDADEILENAADRIAELSSARFELDGTGQIEVEDVGEVSLSNAVGAVERPGRAQVEFDLDAAGMEVPLTVVSIDGDVYFTDVFTGNWQSAPDEFQFNPAIIFDEDDGLPALIRSIEDAEVLGTEAIDGRDAYKIYGVVDRELIEEGTAGTFQAEEDVDFNIWIDQETYDVLQVRAEDPTDESDSIWEMRIYDHDEEVDIEDPTEDDDS